MHVKYAIHPVARRMLGHMNVLLAEAYVPYEQAVEMEDVNSEFGQADVVFVIGANDVVSPAAKTIIVNKCSMAAGYAGLDNELFYLDKTIMVSGDAKHVVEEIVKAI